MSGLANRIGKRQPFSSPEQEAYLNLALSRELLGAPFERLFRAAGLSESTYNILRILRGTHPEPLPVLEIRRRMVTRVPDITRLLDRLERLGFVERKRCGNDRRVFYCHITPAGLAAIQPLDDLTLAEHKKQLGHLTEDELKSLSALLEKARAPWDADQKHDGSTTAHTDEHRETKAV